MDPQPGTPQAGTSCRRSWWQSHFATPLGARRISCLSRRLMVPRQHETKQRYRATLGWGASESRLDDCMHHACIGGRAPPQRSITFHSSIAYTVPAVTSTMHIQQRRPTTEPHPCEHMFTVANSSPYKRPVGAPPPRWRSVERHLLVCLICAEFGNLCPPRSVPVAYVVALQRANSSLSDLSGCTRLSTNSFGRIGDRLRARGIPGKSGAPSIAEPHGLDVDVSDGNTSQVM